MHKVCILTDSSVQFTQIDYFGNELVSVIPFSTRPERFQDFKDPLNGIEKQFGIVPPPIEEIIALINILHQDHPEIMVVTLSSALSELYSRVEKAVGKLGAIGRIKLIDSHTTSIGLGLLVQLAAGLAAEGAPIEEIEHQLRISIGKIYTMLCLPDLVYLSDANFLSYSQAVVGEMLGILPIFSLENGRLTSIQKVRTQRHLLETFQEFVDEFNDLYFVGIIKKTNLPKTLPFKEYIKANFPKTIFVEHPLGGPLADLLGPQSVGLIVIEDKLGKKIPNHNRIQ